MPAEGLRAAPNENSMQTLRHRFYSAVIMPPHWQMKTSMAGRENNEVVKKKKPNLKTDGSWCVTAHRRYHPAVIPLAGWVERSPPDEGKAQVQLQGGPVWSKRLQGGKVAVKVPAVSLFLGATLLARHRSEFEHV